MGPEGPRHQHDRPDAHPGPVGSARSPRGPGACRPRCRRDGARCRDRPEGLRAARILSIFASSSYSAIASRSSLRFSRLCWTSMGGIRQIVLRARRRAHLPNGPSLIARWPGRPRLGRSRALPPLRWLSGADVIAAMPPARGAPATRRADDDRARPAPAQPAPTEDRHPPAPGGLVRPRDAVAPPWRRRVRRPRGDEVGRRLCDEHRARPAGIHAVVVVNDPETGIPTAMLDGGPITAERTAAVSGVACGISGRSPARVASGRRPRDRDDRRRVQAGRTSPSSPASCRVPGCGSSTDHRSERRPRRRGSLDPRHRLGGGQGHRARGRRRRACRLHGSVLRTGGRATDDDQRLAPQGRRSSPSTTRPTAPRRSRGRPRCSWSTSASST